jgi:hypothetical protein
MIKKLRNQPYAPKFGASFQMGAKRKKKVIYYIVILKRGIVGISQT